MKEKEQSITNNNIIISQKVLNELLLHLKSNPSKLAKELGYKSNVKIQHIKSGRNGISSDVAADIVNKYPYINYDWLLTGEGEMINNNQPTEVQNKDTNKPYINYNRMPAVITVRDDEEENIEAVPIKLAAGYVGGGYADQSFVEELPKFRLPYVKGGTFRCFEIQGYSMYNGIRDGDFFVGRFLDNIRDFGEGKIYALIIPEFESLLIKRVFRHHENPHILILKSDNNDLSNIYPDIHLHVKYIAEMWSYAATISLKEPHFDMDKSREISATNPKIVSYTDK
ncbi:hypothetical protein HZP42_13030 [Elizabethkingia anophelis]|nr:hypothetical protein [Elizabethkingia anophelis]